MSINVFKKKFLFKKPLAFFLACLLSTGQWSFAGISKKPQENLSSVDEAAFSWSSEFKIPPDIGRIREQELSDLSGSSKEVIIQIQDSHCLYEAQRNIGRMIDFLHRRYGLQLITVEGAAAGPVDLSLFGAFPEKKIRDRVVDDLVIKGIISGPEQVAIRDYGQKNSPSLYGTENVRLYYENLVAFRNVHTLLDKASVGLYGVDVVCKSLKKAVFSRNLFKLEAQVEAFQRGDISLTDYVPELIEAYQKSVKEQTA
ncbi:MAG: hypothetical protein P9M03_11185, partial [Candidatus Theseobacter exili]|nr:hypothetical protein [Candidatus Theseobacter exili]